MRYAPIIIEEAAGIDRSFEPVTVGVPFPAGLIRDPSELTLEDGGGLPVPVQTEVLARWKDRTPKWVLLDFQASVAAFGKEEYRLRWGGGRHAACPKRMDVSEKGGLVRIDTGEAVFFLDDKVLKPFQQVEIQGRKVVKGGEGGFVLSDKNGMAHRALIEEKHFEACGPLRVTLRTEGAFRSSSGEEIASFSCALSFYLNSTAVRIDFTVLNPRPAKHPGGLWDLGDPGSVFFEDLSFHVAAERSGKDPEVMYETGGEEKGDAGEVGGPLEEILIYQDSSGGDNWKSRNHVNRNNEIMTAFRGFRACRKEKILAEGNRATPVVWMGCQDRGIGGTVLNFWENFPSALEAGRGRMTFRLFPKYQDDLFELQGGEQKTQTVYLGFGGSEPQRSHMRRAHSPMVPRSTQQWYALAGVFDYAVPENPAVDGPVMAIAEAAIEGDYAFSKRREIVDEYGWRHFGELYADHEGAENTGAGILISHYNNQYDSIYGGLIQFVRSGDRRWFNMADQLCAHVKDIDIYHTDLDRPEYNRGMFWHTDHHIDVRTATHRCFSKGHCDKRDMAFYGGGPSLSHNYSSGLLLHYYLTGATSSRRALKEIASFVIRNIEMDNTVLRRLIGGVRQGLALLKHRASSGHWLLGKESYGLDGPGRPSGNALNTLVDAHTLTADPKYLKTAENLVLQCVRPDEDIAQMDLLDVENKWMYTVFLQSLGKYIDAKTRCGQLDGMREYARRALINYARWMSDKEHLYLDRPEKLEFPNETWAAQDYRKCNVLLYASKYAGPLNRALFVEKAGVFFSGAHGHMDRFETKNLTRPVALTLLNGMMYGYFMDPANAGETVCSAAERGETVMPVKRQVGRDLLNAALSFSLKNEIEFLRWRIP